jgi:putative membrane protein
LYITCFKNLEGLNLKLLLSWVLNAVALMAVAYLLPGVMVDGVWAALWAALILGLVNTIVKPVLVVLTLPLTVVTLGLFYFVLNGLMFYWVGSVLDGFRVDGFWWAVIASLLYSLFATLMSSLLFQEKVRIERIS